MACLPQHEFGENPGRIAELLSSLKLQEPAAALGGSKVGRLALLAHHCVLRHATVLRSPCEH
jgi:hypothetical protein